MVLYPVFIYHRMKRIMSRGLPLIGVRTNKDLLSVAPVGGDTNRGDPRESAAKAAGTGG